MAGEIKAMTINGTRRTIKDETARSAAEQAQTTANSKQDELTFDTAPTEGSTNPVTSDGIYNAIAMSEYHLPTASETTLGGVKVGNGLDMTGEVLSVDIEDAGAIPAAEKGSAGGVAELDSNGLVLSSQLPSYVDDVLEYSNVSAFPATGESGKIYVATDTNLTYRWTGSAYTEISASLALGETSSTAYRGDRGAAAYAHAVTNKGAAFASNLYKITTNSEGHVTAATPATSADIVAFLNSQDLTPASVTATGKVQAATIEDSGGTLAALRESVSQKLPFYTIHMETQTTGYPNTDNADTIFDGTPSETCAVQLYLRQNWLLLKFYVQDEYAAMLFIGYAGMRILRKISNTWYLTVLSSD